MEANNTSPQNSDHRVVAALRLLDLLECFETQRRPLTLQEIADFIGVPRSSTFRLLHTLEGKGYIESYANTGTYWLTSRLYNIGRVAVIENPMRQLAVSDMENLHRRFNEKINLGALCRYRIVYVDTIVPAGASRLRATIGDIAYAHAASLGKAILAFLPETQVDEIITHAGMPRLTRRTHRTLEALKEDLAQTRQRGYAVNQGELEENQYAMSVPLFNAEQTVIGSLCVSGTHTSINEKDPEIVITALLEAGLRVSRRHGYRLDTGIHPFYHAVNGQNAN